MILLPFTLLFGVRVYTPFLCFLSKEYPLASVGEMVWWAFHPKTMNFTFFSSAHRNFFRIDHILGHKSRLGKFKKTEIIPSIFSDHNAVRLDVNYRRKTIKNSNIWRLNNTLLNNQQITEEIKKEIKLCIETNENENTTTQNL